MDTTETRKSEQKTGHMFITNSLAILLLLLLGQIFFIGWKNLDKNMYALYNDILNNLSLKITLKNKSRISFSAQY